MNPALLYPVYSHGLSGIEDPRVPTPETMPETAEYAREARYHYRPGSRCDHDTVLRYYSCPEKILFCDTCGQPNRFLYTCTADTDDFSPFESRREAPRRGVDLLPWPTILAICRGEYSDEQVCKLIDQKTDVHIKIGVDLDNAFACRRSTSNEETHNLLKRQSVQDWVSWMMNQPGVIHGGGILQNLNEYIAYMPCQMRMCAVCQEHRNLAQKSFQSLNAVLNEPVASHIPLPEYLNRPVISADVAARLPQGREVQSESNESTVIAEMEEMEDSEDLAYMELVEGLDELEGLDLDQLESEIGPWRSDNETESAGDHWDDDETEDAGDHWYD